MKVSYNWLQQYVDIDVSTEKTGELLTLAGLEVDEVEKFGNLLDGVVVGQVTDCTKHPNADRLWLCQVDLGGEEVQIVCGANNVQSGQRVPVATVGTELPVKDENGDNFVIREAELRGEKSNGMICSEEELGLGDDHEGIMVLESDANPGTPLKEALDLEVDTVFDIELTPNRPDAASHIGVARDLSAVLDKDLTSPYSSESDLPEADPLDEAIEIQIENPDRCNRYVAKMITDVTVQPSPQWLKNRLKSIGIRPINNIVDVTNYVLNEIGQPLHAFDYDLINGQRIVVKEYNEERTFTTLDDVERTLSPGTLFICDDEGPIAIAGVMGGQNSEINEQTTTVLLESAYFSPSGIRRTSKEQNITTDSSYRFERGIDPNMTRKTAERAAELIAEVSGGTVEKGCTDVHPVQTEPVEIELRIDYLNKLLGTSFEVDEAADIINRLQLNVTATSEDAITCRVPTFRPDITRPVDLIEEVGRIHDFNNIPSPDYVKFPKPQPKGSYEILERRIKQAVKSLRFKEIYTNSLLPEEKANLYAGEDELIETLNPVSRDMAVLRPSLTHGFLSAVSYNFNRKVHSVRFFEVGQTFQKSDNGTYQSGIKEETRLLMGLSGQKNIEHWRTEAESYDFFDLKESLTAFLDQLDLLNDLKEDRRKQTLYYLYKDQVVGRLFSAPESLLDEYEIEQPTFVAELSVTRIENIKQELPGRSYQSVSKYPTFEFDLDLVIDKSIPAADLMQTIQETAGDILIDKQIFDVFEGGSLGDQKKSLAFRLTFLDRTKTLTIDDVQPIINKVLNTLSDSYNAELRS